jgi:hypothetical protein
VKNHRTRRVADKPSSVLGINAKRTPKWRQPPNVSVLPERSRLGHSPQITVLSGEHWTAFSLGFSRSKTIAGSRQSVLTSQERKTPSTRERKHSEEEKVSYPVHERLPLTASPEESGSTSPRTQQPQTRLLQRSPVNSPLSELWSSLSFVRRGAHLRHDRYVVVPLLSVEHFQKVNIFLSCIRISFLHVDATFREASQVKCKAASLQP